MNGDLRLTPQTALTEPPSDSVTVLSSTDQATTSFATAYLEDAANVPSFDASNSTSSGMDQRPAGSSGKASLDNWNSHVPYQSSSAAGHKKPLTELLDQTSFVEALLKQPTFELTTDHPSIRASVMIDVDQNITIVTKRVIGSGSFGTIYQAQASDQTQEESLKMAHKSDDTSLAREYSVLKQVNPNGLPGLQLAPRLFVNLSDDTGRQVPGFLAPRYQSDMQEMRLETHDTIRQAFSQLSSGVLLLHEKGFYHGDIKPENMLQMPGRNDIADLGTVKNALDIEREVAAIFALDNEEDSDAISQAAKKIFGPNTEAFVNIIDIASLEELLSEYAKDARLHPEQRGELIQRAISDILLVMQGRDVYALSLSLSQLTLAKGETRTGPKENHAFFQTEPASTADAIHECLKKMIGRPANLDPATIRSCYLARIQALKDLQQLMQL